MKENMASEIEWSFGPLCTPEEIKMVKQAFRKPDGGSQLFEEYTCECEEPKLHVDVEKRGPFFGLILMCKNCPKPIRSKEITFG